MDPGILVVGPVMRAVKFNWHAETWPERVSRQDCECQELAQDGRRCELHKEDGRRWGKIDLCNGMRGTVEHGEWLVRREESMTPYWHWEVCSVREFNKKYRPYEPERAERKEI